MTDPIRIALPDREVLARMIYDALVQSLQGGNEYASLFDPKEFIATFDGEFDFRFAADRLTGALAAAKDQTND